MNKPRWPFYSYDPKRGKRDRYDPKRGKREMAVYAELAKEDEPMPEDDTHEELDHTVRRIAEHYDFRISFREDTGKWQISSEAIDFYWSTWMAENEQLGGFLDSLRCAFVRVPDDEL